MAFGQLSKYVNNKNIVSINVYSTPKKKKNNKNTKNEDPFYDEFGSFDDDNSNKNKKNDDINAFGGDNWNMF